MKRINSSFFNKNVIGLSAILCGISVQASAQTLVSSINNLFGSGGITFPDQLIHGFPETHFISSSLTALGTLSSSLASSSNNIPVISTAPGIGFVYNSDLQSFEPTNNNNVGSLYLEGGKTNGAGKFSVGVNYSYVDYLTLNGQNLAGYDVTLYHQQISPEHAMIDVNFNKFNISSSIISNYFTYGITDKWDVNLMIPVMVTDVNVQATATINNGPVIIGGRTVGATSYAFNNGQLVNTYSTSGHKVGVGDLVIRNKYQFFELDGLNLSGLLKMTFPTGDAANFQGTGDYYIQPYFAASQTYGNFDFHGNAGVDVDLSYSDHSRARYGVGVSYKFLESTGLMVDIIGSSNMTNQSISNQVPQYSIATGAQTGVNTVTSQISTNILDISMGVKTSIFKRANAYVNFLVPLNNDGLRAGFVPSAGFQIPL